MNRLIKILVKNRKWIEKLSDFTDTLMIPLFVSTIIFEGNLKFKLQVILIFAFLFWLLIYLIKEIANVVEQKQKK